MRVAEFTRNSSAISRTTPIREAERVLISRGLKILPVTDRGRIVGVVTRGDIARALPSDATTLSKWEIGYWLDEVKVEEFMKEPVAVTPDMSLFEVVELAARRGFYNFPVVADGVLKGMIYEEDIFRCLADAAKRPAVKIEISLNGAERKRTSLLRRIGFGGAL